MAMLEVCIFALFHTACSRSLMKTAVQGEGQMIKAGAEIMQISGAEISPDHAFDFRDCNNSIMDTGANGTGIVATVKGASCSADGMVFDGTDDYVELTTWEFGGESLTMEAYVKYNNVNNNLSRIFDFATTADDRVFFDHRNDGRARWRVTGDDTVDNYQAGLISSSRSYFEENAWMHIVATCDDTTMKLYKNGVSTDTKADDQVSVPTKMTRGTHWVGRASYGDTGYFYGTIAYLRFWHGQALDESQVAQIYAGRNSVSNLPTAPTPSPTPSPPLPAPTASGSATAIDDPHVTNSLGEQFDLWQLGQVQFFRVPYEATEATADFVLNAMVRNVSSDWQSQACLSPYISEAAFSGRFFTQPVTVYVDRPGRTRVHIGGVPVHLSAERIIVGNTSGQPVFIKNPESMIRVNGKYFKANHVVEVLVEGATIHITAGKAHINIIANGLLSFQKRVGGLLGEDDHRVLAEVPLMCDKRKESGSSRKIVPLFLQRRKPGNAASCLTMDWQDATLDDDDVDT